MHLSANSDAEQHNNDDSALLIAVRITQQMHTVIQTGYDELSGLGLGTLTLRRRDDSVAKQGLQLTPHGYNGKEIWRRRCGQQDTSGGLEEDGGGSTEQSSRWKGLCSTHRERQCLRRKRGTTN